MKDIRNLGGEMLEHLRFYRDLGVRLAAKAPGSVGRDVAASRRREAGSTRGAQAARAL